MNQGVLQVPPTDRAVRAGAYTFYFTHISPQPTGEDFINQTLGFIVQAGLMVQHDDALQHHGDSLINACYALFAIQNVDAMIQQKKDDVVGHMNGSGGMSGAVVLSVRAARNLHRTPVPALQAAGAQFGKLIEHIFEEREVQRAIREVRRNP